MRMIVTTNEQKMKKKMTHLTGDVFSGLRSVKQSARQASRDLSFGSLEADDEEEKNVMSSCFFLSPGSASHLAPCCVK
jgi:hypothetical protein